MGNTDKRYWVYLQEKWQNEKKKELLGDNNFSNESKEYLIEKYFEDVIFLFELLVNYCFNPKDIKAENRFIRYVENFPDELENFIKVIEFSLKEDSNEVILFLRYATNKFGTTKGEYSYPGKEKAKEYIYKIISFCNFSKPLKEILINSEKKIQVLEELIGAGQLQFSNNEYIPLKTMPNLCSWMQQNGFEDISAEFIHKYIKTECTLETLKKYIRNAKEKVKNG